MKNILVLTDFSRCANNAVRYAIQLSKQYDFNLVFYHSTYQYFYVGMDESIARKTIQHVEEDLTEELIKSIKKQYSKLKITPKNIKYKVHYGTHLTERIKEITEQEKIDLIIMGTKGASGIDRILFGSNTAKVIDRADCPVLSIPTNKKFKLIKKILLFTDGSDLKSELHDIITTVKKLKCVLDVCHLTDNSKDTEDRINKIIEATKEKYRYDAIKPILVKRNYEKSIVTQVENITSILKPDMICMHTIKYNWLEKLITTSYTKDLVYHSKTSILTFSKKQIFEPILL